MKCKMGPVSILELWSLFASSSTAVQLLSGRFGGLSAQPNPFFTSFDEIYGDLKAGHRWSSVGHFWHSYQYRI